MPVINPLSGPRTFQVVFAPRGASEVTVVVSQGTARSEARVPLSPPAALHAGWNKLRHGLSPVQQRKLLQELRQARYQARNGEKGWQEVLPPSIVAWAWAEFSSRTEGLDCVDNYRVARAGNSAQNRRYRKKREAGCCGSMDITIPGPDGSLYHLGCNYGH